MRFTTFIKDKFERSYNIAIEDCNTDNEMLFIYCDGELIHSNRYDIGVSMAKIKNDIVDFLSKNIIDKAIANTKQCNQDSGPDTGKIADDYPTYTYYNGTRHVKAINFDDSITSPSDVLNALYNSKIYFANISYILAEKMTDEYLNLYRDKNIIKSIELIQDFYYGGAKVLVRSHCDGSDIEVTVMYTNDNIVKVSRDDGTKVPKLIV